MDDTKLAEYVARMSDNLNSVMALVRVNQCLNMALLSGLSEGDPEAVETVLDRLREELSDAKGAGDDAEFIKRIAETMSLIEQEFG